MTNILVVTINSPQVPKIKKILLYEMKFLVPNYSCLQNPWLEGYRPQIPVLSVLNWICWTPPPNKIPGYATGRRHTAKSQMIVCCWLCNCWIKYCMEYGKQSWYRSGTPTWRHLDHPLLRSSNLKTAVFHVSLMSVHYADCNIHVMAPVRATDRAV